MSEITFKPLNFQYTDSIFLGEQEAVEYFLIKNISAFILATIITIITAGTGKQVLLQTLANFLTSLSEILKFNIQEKKFAEELKKFVYGKLYGQGLKFLDEIEHAGKKYRLNIAKMKFDVLQENYHKYCCEDFFGACKKYYHFRPITLKTNMNPLILLYFLLLLKNDAKYQHLINDEQFAQIVVALSLIAKYPHEHSNVPKTVYKYSWKPLSWWYFVIEKKGNFLEADLQWHETKNWSDSGFSWGNKEQIKNIIHAWFTSTSGKFVKYDFVVQNQDKDIWYRNIIYNQSFIKDILDKSDTIMIRQNPNKIEITGQLKHPIEIIRFSTITPNTSEATIILANPYLAIIMLNTIVQKYCKNKNVYMHNVNNFFSLNEIVKRVNINCLEGNFEFYSDTNFYDANIYEEYAKKENEQNNENPIYDDAEKKEDIKPIQEKPKFLPFLFLIGGAILWNLSKK